MEPCTTGGCVAECREVEAALPENPARPAEAAIVTASGEVWLPAGEAVASDAGHATYRWQEWSTGRARPPAAMICCEGEVDLASAEPLREFLKAEALAERSRIVIDFSGARFVDSTALGLLIIAQRRCRLAGGEVVIVGCQPRVRAIFSVTRLDRVMRLFTTLPAAFEAIGSS